ncbi:hypothetical protein Tco_0185903 [Tanacetum coccineum]
MSSSSEPSVGDNHDLRSISSRPLDLEVMTPPGTIQFETTIVEWRRRSASTILGQMANLFAVIAPSVGLAFVLSYSAVVGLNVIGKDSS